MDGISFWAWIAPLIVGAVGGLAGVFLASLTKAGERFVGHNFDRRIEKFKSGLEGEIENLKAKLALVSDRGIRANEREFNALIAAWEAYATAFVATKGCVISMMHIPPFEKMENAEAARILKTTEFSEIQQDAVLNANDKQHAYSQIVQLRLINAARSSIYEAHEALRKQGIFFPQELEDSFFGALDMLGKAVAQRNIEFEYGRGADMPKDYGGLFKEGDQIFQSLKGKVRARITKVDL